MKNILLAINSDKPCISCMQFGCYLAQLTQSKLSILFVEKHTADTRPSLKIKYGMPYVETIIASDLPSYAEHEKTRSVYIETFRKICGDHGVRYHVHTELESRLEGLIAETRFADILILDRNISLEDQSDVPSRFLKDIFAKTECPVLVAPISFDTVDELLFAFEDTKSSAFAIKQFSCLFPELEDVKVTMLHVQKHSDENNFQQEKLSQWVSVHYSYPVFKIMTGKPSSELYKYLYNKKRTLVIMGSYGRDRLSTIMFPSTADPLLANLNLPFFFAHH